MLNIIDEIIYLLNVGYRNNYKYSSIYEIIKIIDSLPIEKQKELENNLKYKEIIEKINKCYT